MEYVESIPDLIDVVPGSKTSEISNFVNAEQNVSEEYPTAPSSAVDPPPPADDDERDDKDELPPAKADEPVYQDILGSGCLLKKIVKRGSADDRPMKGEQIVINLVGRLEKGGDVVEEEKNLEITLGDCEVIHGVDLALSLMYLGETAELKIASRFGYGEIGLETKVPSGANLVYVVDLLSIKPEIIPDELTPSERLKIGQRKKDRGNWWYARNENTLALHIYRKALQYLGGSGEKISSDLTEQSCIQNERVKTLNNMAAVHMSMNSLDIALQSLDSVLAVEPTNEKALMRKGKVLSLKGQNRAAACELKRVLQINPNNKIVQSILNNVEAALVKERVQERELYKKMLGHKDKCQKSIEDNNKTNTTYIISGLVAGLAVICGYCYFNNNFPFNKFSTF